MKVKDTYLSKIQPGDVLLYRAGALLWPDFDVLGALISGLEGNQGRDEDGDGKTEPGRSKGDYTHCAWVRDIPDPEAEVEEVSDRPGIFKVKNGQTTFEVVEFPSEFADEKKTVNRLRCPMGIRVHATWPVVKEESVDWENPHMEVWRIRRMIPAIAAGVFRLANDMIGYQYDLAEFLSFGFLHLPSAKICSEFIADLAYNASILLSDEAPICLTPDISGNKDCEKTPNDIINSGEMIKIRFQGVL